MLREFRKVKEKSQILEKSIDKKLSEISKELDNFHEILLWCPDSR